MLETVSQVGRHLSSSMPVNFTTYLLSSSPPASNLEILNYAFSHEAARNWSQERVADNFMRSPLKQPEKKLTLKSIIQKNLSCDELNNNEEDLDSFSSSAPSSGSVTPTSPRSPKKVSFADHKGFALTTVRIMTEPSDMPPRLGPDVISSLTNGAKASVFGPPPYELKFTQPASDYLAFREKIEKICVSLENVILRDYCILGTIKVKNLCFHKHVFVRITFDSWETSQDIAATFVQNPGDNSVHAVDTFSFELDISTTCDTSKKMEFAVCFETPSGQYWDSNYGKNYVVSPTNYKFSQNVNQALPTNTNESLRKVGSWTEYSCWKHVDTASPYW